MGDPLPHRYLLTKHLATGISTGSYQGDPKRRTNYLSYFLQGFILVHTESLYRHPFTIVDAFPNVGITAREDGVLCRLYEPPWNDVGGW